MLHPARERCSANSNIDRDGTRYRAMKDRIVEIPTKAGRMPTFVTHPEQDGPFPPVIVFMDVWGVRDELYDIARRIGTIGYYAMVPDFYCRQGMIRRRECSITAVSKRSKPGHKSHQVFPPEAAHDTSPWRQAAAINRAAAAACASRLPFGTRVLHAAQAPLPCACRQSGSRREARPLSSLRAASTSDARSC